MKHVTAIYFSPTGGTKKYVRALARALDENYTDIDLTRLSARAKDYAFGPDDLVIFGAPVYAGRLPMLPEGLFDRVAGDGTAAVFTVTYGNREFDDALLEMKNLCEGRGFRGVAAAAFLAEHTYSGRLAGGRPEAADISEAAAFAEKVAEKLAGDAWGNLQVPGNTPYKQAKRLPMHTETAEHCVECGFCARICPAGAIMEQADFPSDAEKCIGCLACVKNCPRGARVVNDPGLAAIRAKLEPALSGVHKDNQYFL